MISPSREVGRGGNAKNWKAKIARSRMSDSREDTIEGLFFVVRCEDIGN